ncbi:MAG: hypothetical protein ABWY06_21955 [Pseudomonas sp.]|uniref:hypothetical protein n=1 Tax=Pseudomonas sp. TaxID=306 RepID=UPI003398641F
MKTIFLITLLATSTLTPFVVFGSEVTQQKLNELIDGIGYLCGNDGNQEKDQKPEAIIESYNNQLKQRKVELQSHIADIGGWDLSTSVEEAVFSNTTRSTTRITQLIYLLGAADPSYANPVLQRIYDQSESIAETTLQVDIQPEIRADALNSSTIDITSAVIDAIELSGTTSLNEILEKEAVSTKPLSNRAREVLKNLKG